MSESVKPPSIESAISWLYQLGTTFDADGMSEEELADLHASFLYGGLVLRRVLDAATGLCDCSQGAECRHRVSRSFLTVEAKREA